MSFIPIQSNSHRDVCLFIIFSKFTLMLKATIFLKVIAYYARELFFPEFLVPYWMSVIHKSLQ